MGYEEALAWLYGQLPMFSRVGAAAYKPGLETSLALDAHFGHPHRQFQSIHIGGTNGKGSTSHMLASILQSQGYKTGLYTSPHLVDFRERMRVNGGMISKERVTDFVSRWRSSGYEGHPSFFELTMAMAFEWFAAEQVDYAVIEVGMGGRLDSTNIITPLVSVITNISPDHTQFLGDTLPAIAAEKAGIIKPGIPAVVGEAEGEVRDVFEQRAADAGTSVTFAGDSPMLDSAERCDGGWECRSGSLAFTVPLGGDYQLHNIETVLQTVRALRKSGMEIGDDAVRKGMEGVLANTGFMGRWTILSRTPLTIADTGHNVAGLGYNMAQLGQLMSARPAGARLRIVIGFVADKAIDKILALLPRDAEYYITNAAIPRALPAAELHKRMQAVGLKGEMYGNVRGAYEAALSASGPDDILYVGGSTFVVADLLASPLG